MSKLLDYLMTQFLLLKVIFAAERNAGSPDTWYFNSKVLRKNTLTASPFWSLATGWSMTTVSLLRPLIKRLTLLALLSKSGQITTTSLALSCPWRILLPASSQSSRNGYLVWYCLLIEAPWLLLRPGNWMFPNLLYYRQLLEKS